MLAVQNGIFVFVILTLIVCDMRLWRVPRSFALPALTIGIFFGVIGTHPTLMERLVGIAGGFITLWCVHVISTFVLRIMHVLSDDEFAMGAGDPLMLAVVGSFMGYSKLPLVVFLGGVQGVLAYAVPKLFPRLAFEPPEKSTLAVMPFAVFLGLAALEVLLLASF